MFLCSKHICCSFISICFCEFSFYDLFDVQSLFFLENWIVLLFCVYVIWIFYHLFGSAFRSQNERQIQDLEFCHVATVPLNFAILFVISFMLLTLTFISHIVVEYNVCGLDFWFVLCCHIALCDIQIFPSKKKKKKIKTHGTISYNSN